MIHIFTKDFSFDISFSIIFVMYKMELVFKIECFNSPGDNFWWSIEAKVSLTGGVFFQGFHIRGESYLMQDLSLNYHVWQQSITNMATKRQNNLRPQ